MNEIMTVINQLKLFMSPVCLFSLTAVHCNISQNGVDRQVCPQDMMSQLEEEEESVDAGAALLDDDSPPMYQRRPPPQRSVSESELTRVRGGVCVQPRESHH